LEEVIFQSIRFVQGVACVLTSPRWEGSAGTRRERARLGAVWGPKPRQPQPRIALCGGASSPCSGVAFALALPWRLQLLTAQMTGQICFKCPRSPWTCHFSKC